MSAYIDSMNELEQLNTNNVNSVCDILKSMVEQAGESNLKERIATNGENSRNGVDKFKVMEENTGLTMMDLSLNDSITVDTNGDGECEELIDSSDEANDKVGNRNEQEDKLNNTSDSLDCEITEVITKKKVKKSTSYDNNSAKSREFAYDEVVNAVRSNINLSNPAFITTSNNSYTTVNNIASQMPQQTSSSLFSPLTYLKTTNFMPTTIVIKPTNSFVKYPLYTIPHMANSKPDIEKVIDANPLKSSTQIYSPSTVLSYNNFIKSLECRQPAQTFFAPAQKVSPQYMDILNRIQSQRKQQQSISDQLLCKLATDKKRNDTTHYLKLLNPNGPRMNGSLAESIKVNTPVCNIIPVNESNLTGFDNSNKMTSFGNITFRCWINFGQIPQLKCGCGFKTFSNCSLENHKRSVTLSSSETTRCCYCMKFSSRLLAKFSEHMTTVHDVECKFLKPMSSFMCDYCPFDAKESRKLLSHLKQCQKKFNLDCNLMTFSDPYDLPLVRREPTIHNVKTLKNISISNNSNNLKLLPTKNPGFISQLNQQRQQQQQEPQQQQQASSLFSASNLNVNQMPPLTLAQIQDLIKKKKIAIASATNNSNVHFPIKIIPHMNFSAAGKMKSAQGFPLSLTSTTNIQTLPSSSTSSFSAPSSNINQKLFDSKQKTVKEMFKEMQINSKLNSNQSAVRSVNYSKKINQLTKNIMNNVKVSNPKKGSNKSIASTPGPSCEICSEKIENLDCLLLHFNAIHKLKIYDINFFTWGKRFVCRICFEAFWTKAGLNTHHHFAHNVEIKYCKLCDSLKSNIIQHLSTVHNKTLLDMFILKFCYICYSKLDNFDTFASHMCGNHGDIFPSLKFLQGMLRMVKLDTPVTQPPAKKCKLSVSQLADNISRCNKQKYKCEPCNTKFFSAESLDCHRETKHRYPCTRCTQKFPSTVLVRSHFSKAHANDRDRCPLCREMVRIGVPMIRHIRRIHLKRCTVDIPRLPNDIKSFVVTSNNVNYNNNSNNISNNTNNITNNKNNTSTTASGLQNVKKSSSSSSSIICDKVAVVSLIDLATIDNDDDDDVVKCP
ncbi:hypothetical protein HELRODRAFT_189305 [Helobdella robusta]|uniref:C2H2-type domain-containing protein n=1 Tax=Helobdella robusta TaxID=6412 RepID=T1FQX9_HELRO|nr:hypothetical protein HELRODRAFT_189305 [Helobdella robusta]ESN96601.1 hypothetical protein HELRODRAFT_189305 [Helobdella robusta]